jgi:ribonuclease Z
MTIELNILGTASQLPTADRNQGVYYLRWRGSTILLDPGEGAQRQCVRAGLSVPAIRTILISHFHGDHCLGLPGIIQRLALARVSDPIRLIYPKAGSVYLERLLTCSVFHHDLDILYYPVDQDGLVCHVDELRIEAVFLRHRIPACGYRITKSGGLRFDKEKLAEAGIYGKSVGILEEKGELQTPRGRVKREHVSYPAPEYSFSYVADTSSGEHLNSLMRGANLVLCESTFLESESDLAKKYGHLTTRQAAEAAAKNGVRYMIVTHFSERYRNTGVIEEEIRRIFPHTCAAEDFTRYSMKCKTGSLNIEMIRND